MLKIFCLNVHPERIGENDPRLTWHTFFRSLDQVKKWIKLAPGQLERLSFFFGAALVETTNWYVCVGVVIWG